MHRYSMRLWEYQQQGFVFMEFRLEYAALRVLSSELHSSFCSRHRATKIVFVSSMGCYSIPGIHLPFPPSSILSNIPNHLLEAISIPGLEKTQQK